MNIPKYLMLIFHTITLNILKDSVIKYLARYFTSSQVPKFNHIKNKMSKRMEEKPNIELLSLHHAQMFKRPKEKPNIELLSIHRAI
jgi:hypothetical protein